MGIDRFLSPALLKPALATLGIEKARLDYDEKSRQVVLAVCISGVTKFAAVPCGRTYTLAEICAALDARPSAAPAADPAPIAKPPP